eukprot:9301025-Pyramimonas_sp.AAC.1
MSHPMSAPPMSYPMSLTKPCVFTAKVHLIAPGQRPDDSMSHPMSPDEPPGPPPDEPPGGSAAQKFNWGRLRGGDGPSQVKIAQRFWHATPSLPRPLPLANASPSLHRERSC